MTASITIKFNRNQESAISPLSVGIEAVAELTEQGHVVTEALIDFDNPLVNGPMDIKNIVRRCQYLDNIGGCCKTVGHKKCRWGSTKSCELMSEESLKKDWE